MTRNLLLIFSLLLLTVSSATAQTDVTPFLFDGQVISKPGVQTPAEAIESGLGGIVRVSVTVDASGTVVSVGKASGPGPVCAQVDRADVVAIRAAASAAAGKVRFSPIKEGEPALARSSVEFEFPIRR